MTGPALPLGLGLLAFSTWARFAQDKSLLFGLFLIVGSSAAWLLYVLGIHVAGRISADKGAYTRTRRGLGFANVCMLFTLIGLIPALAPLAAHNARGWRSLILPLLGMIFVVLLPIVVSVMLGGAIFSLEALWATLGLSAEYANVFGDQRSIPGMGRADCGITEHLRDCHHTPAGRNPPRSHCRERAPRAPCPGHHQTQATNRR